MSTISATAQAARESARAGDGRFAAQSHAVPEVTIPVAGLGEPGPEVRERRAVFEARVAAAHQAQLALRRPALDLVSAIIRERFPAAVSVTVSEDGDADGTWVSISQVLDANGQDLCEDTEGTEDADEVLREVSDIVSWIPETTPASYDRRWGLCTFALTEPVTARERDEAAVQAIRDGMPAGVHTVELGYDGSGRLEIIDAGDEHGQSVEIDFWGADGAAWEAIAAHAREITDPDSTDDSDDGRPPFVICRAVAR